MRLYVEMKSLADVSSSIPCGGDPAMDLADDKWKLALAHYSGMTGSSIVDYDRKLRSIKDLTRCIPTNTSFVINLAY